MRPFLARFDMTMVKNLQFRFLGIVARRLSRSAVVTMVAGAALTCFGSPLAMAQTSLMVGSVLSMDGLQITITNCSTQSPGGASGSCAAGQFEMVGSITSSGALDVTFLGGAGGNIYSTSNPGSGYFDLNVVEAITTTGSRTTVSSAQIVLSGSTSDPSVDGTRVHGSGVVTIGGVNTSFRQLDTAPGDATSSTLTFSPVTSLSVNKDFGVLTGGASAGTTLTLASINQIFSPAPEPASISMLVFGLVGLGAARHRWARGSARVASKV